MFEEDLKAAIFALDFLLDLESKINCILLVTFVTLSIAITFSTVFNLF